MHHLRNLSIDRSLLLPKTFYFFFFAALASLIPFLTLHYEQIGLSGRQIGLLTGIPPLMTILGAPLFGGLADATRQHQLFLRLAIGSTLVTILGVYMAPTFFWLLPFVITFAFFFAPIIPLMDNTVLDLLGDRKDQYGKQRLLGSIGWGLAGPIVGLLAEAGLQWAFYGYFVFMFGALLTALRFPVSQASIGRQFWGGLRLLLANWQMAIFLVVAFSGGMALSIINNYLFLYLNELGASTTLMGFSLTTGTIGELVVLYFSDRLLDRLGTRGLLILALLTFVGRVLAYAYIQTAWLVLVIQLLHGPSFAAMWIAGVAYTDDVAPPGMGATAQGLFSGIMIGLGAAFGAMIGGLLYEEVGSVLMFQWTGLGILPALLLFVLAGKRTMKLKPTPTKL